MYEACTNEILVTMIIAFSLIRNTRDFAIYIIVWFPLEPTEYA